MLNSVEHEKSFITSGPGLVYMSVDLNISAYPMLIRLRVWTYELVCLIEY